MRYLCLIYDDEKKWGTIPKAEMDAMMGQYFEFTEWVKKSGHCIGGEALQPVERRFLAARIAALQTSRSA
jgi:hypothetical protein